MLSSTELWFSSSEDEENQFEALRIKRRKLRDNSNPLELPDRVFIKFFRISKDAFTYLLNKVEAKVRQPTKSSSVSPVIKLDAALRFYAEGSYQTCIGKDFNVGVEQSTFSRILETVTGIIEEDITNEMIKFPNASEKSDIKLAFYEKFGFPGVIGCVDGTHIKIISPSNNEKHLYYNRKGFCSLNVMLVCDHKMRITYVDATHPGASHDAFIWSLSRLNEILSSSYERGDRNSWLLADAGYPLRSYLITPFRMYSSTQGNNPVHRFNQLHSKARNIIERTIGVLKNTFRCLLSAREMYYKPEKATKIINACCALHNLRIQYNTPFEDEISIIDDEIAATEVEEDDPTGYASAIRESIMNSIF